MPGRNFTDEQEADIVKRYLAGESCKAIGRSFGLSHHISITAALARQGCEQRPAPDRNRLYTLNPNVFDKIDSEHAAYWWGFLYADGCVSKRTLLLGLKGSDAPHLQKLCDFMGSNLPVHMRFKTCQGKKYTSAQVNFTDRHLVASVARLGIVTGRTVGVSAFKYLPKALINHWLRGFCDGDGSVSKARPAIAFCGDAELLNWIRNILEKYAGCSNDRLIKKHRTAQLYYIHYSGGYIARRVADYLYSDATVWLDRKYERIKHWTEHPRHERGSNGCFIN